MHKYLTWDTKRSRFVFQIRIPLAVRPQFNGRTTIRIHIGNIELAAAEVRCEQLAAQYQHDFAQSISTMTAPTTRPNTQAASMLLGVDAALSARFVATWQHQAAAAFKLRIDALKECADSAWSELEAELQEEHASARTQMRRHDTQELERSVRVIESTHNLRLEISAKDRDEIENRLNSGRVKFYSECLQVIRGEISIHTLFPAPSTQLPIVELWGDPANRLPEFWEKRVRASGGTVNPRTLDTYRRLSTDLDFVLQRRPVQNLGHNNLESVKALWLKRGNGGSTIKRKLDMLKSLLRSLLSASDIEMLFQRVQLGVRVSRVRRLPFTDSQLRKFANAVFDSESLCSDDKMLVALMMFLGARIEELYQLRADDIETTSTGWLVRIADQRQTGSGSARLKNGISARQLPVVRGVLPAMDQWLTERLAEGGFLFQTQSENKYGKRSAAASRRLNRFLRALFPDDRRLVLQSIRNTISRIMRRGKTDPRVRTRFLGHADVGIHDQHYDPGELLDDTDLESGASAIADFLRSNFGQQSSPTVQASTDFHAGVFEHSGHVADVDIGPLVKQQLPLQVQQPKI